MRVSCVVALLISGTSGEISGCVAHADGSHTCHGDMPLGDATSLFQLPRQEKDAFASATLAETAKLTRRCLHEVIDLPGPIDCAVNDWQEWTSCSGFCGSGTRSRSREVTNPGDPDGKHCCLKEAEACSSDCDPEPCITSTWSDWTACSETCGTGTHSRSREVTTPGDHGGACADTEESKACSTDPCSVDCTTSTWSDWTACSETCGDGTRSRSRTVTSAAKYGGTCDETERSEECKVIDCPVPCTLSDWGNWGACSTTCGDGTRSRSRTVTSEAKHGGTCEDTTASETCKEIDCPVPCTLNDWGNWGDCSKTCDDGTRIRFRTVKTAAKYGGTCDRLTASEVCKEKDCPPPTVHDCKLDDWSDWTACGETGVAGTRSRSRKVIIPETHNGTCNCLEEAEACAPPGDLTTKFKVCGIVRDAIDTLQSPIPGATVQIQGQGQGQNLDPTTTGEQGQDKGKFCFAEVAQGKVTLTATKTGYVTTTMTLNIAEGMDDIKVLMTKTMKITGWRIILEWGMTPLDLDARTQFGTVESQCAVKYDNKDVTCPSNGIRATLDQDHCFYKGSKHTCPTQGFSGPSTESKPETTTLYEVDPDMQCSGNDCKIVFHVSNYMSCLHYSHQYTPTDYCSGSSPDEDTGTLRASQAEVTVYHGESQVATFKIAELDAKKDGVIRYPDSTSDKGFGSVEEWWVFYIDVKTSTVHACNNDGGNCF